MIADWCWLGMRPRADRLAMTAQVERLLLEQGRLEPLALMIALDLLRYEASMWHL
jgi:hypothetical protein